MDCCSKSLPWVEEAGRVHTLVCNEDLELKVGKDWEWQKQVQHLFRPDPASAHTHWTSWASSCLSQLFSYMKLSLCISVCRIRALVSTFTHLAWIFRLLEVANCRLHTSHLYGFSSPWCIRLWKTSWHFWAKPLSHNSHLYGFSPGKEINCYLSTVLVSM